ncbi:MAG: DUF2975 domain-containing protein [Firmicutes bacterium]|nr:DUF2975 domain-containing protein [Bacillota bacterium]
MRSEEYLQKYHGVTKFLRILAQISFWLVVVLGAASLALGVATLFMSSDSFTFNFLDNIRLSMDGVLQFDLSLANITATTKKEIITTILFALSSFAIIYGLIISQLTSFLKTVENGMPFASANVKRLNMIGILFIVGSFIINTVYGLVANKIIHALGISTLSVNLQSDANMLFMGIIIIILAGIFRYGSYLQDEYDATI